MKASKQEPAERFAVFISAAEVIVLAKYHQREAKSLTARYGRAAFSLAAGVKPKGSELKALHEVAGHQVTAHLDRAKQLLGKDFIKQLKKAKS
jgi:hypothetical protein